MPQERTDPDKYPVEDLGTVWAPGQEPPPDLQPVGERFEGELPVEHPEVWWS